MQRHHVIRLSGLLVLTAVVAACGGSGSRGTSVARSTVAEVGATEPASAGTDTTSPAAQTPAFAAAGAPTGLVSGGNGTEPVAATLSGRDCTIDGLFGTCRGAAGSGGEFVVASHNDPADYSIWTVVVGCGTQPATPIASVKAKQLVATADLTFATYGDVAGIVRHAEGASEAFLVYQPSGATCPNVFGLGPIQPNSIMTAGTDVVGVTRPDGTLACARADAAAGFVVTEGQTGC